MAYFFDKISPTASQLSTYQSYVSHAQSQGFTFIGLDPGETVADASYFSIANLVNTYEGSYSSFNPASLTGTMSQQSVILVNSPTTGTYTAIISQLENLGVEAVYISTVADTSQALPAQLSEFASEIASAGGGATSGSTGSSGSSGTTGSSGSAGSATNTKGDAPSATSFTLSNPTAGSGSSTGTISVSAKGVTSSAQSAGASGSSSSPGVPNTNQSPAANHNGSPIAAIVGAVLGALIILLILLVVFLCLRRRRKSSASEVVVPFTEVRNLNPTEPLARFTESSIVSPTDAPSHLWNTNTKELQSPPEASMSGNNTTLADQDVSFTVSGPRTARHSAAPTYGSAWESLGGTSGPPPSYHNDD
ncbi:hypothetical protein MSAN_02405300 [Mycena sanguinolenta]|uniref:Uncharacterized protein n=1 Tax=Mycena sanguinolenta TaxID=230812 RepID=A0A8H7CDJ4_9AGAR|nr:hypothetical protein MSAN_02405300 [Mycena sanguinolenta]